MSDVMIETYPERTSTQESGCLPVRMTVNGEARTCVTAPRKSGRTWWITRRSR
jgi:hypothetical protein